MDPLNQLGITSQPSVPASGSPASPAPAAPAPQLPGPTLNGVTFTYDVLNPRGGQRTEQMPVVSPRFQPKAPLPIPQGPLTTDHKP